MKKSHEKVYKKMIWLYNERIYLQLNYYQTRWIQKLRKENINDHRDPRDSSQKGLIEILTQTKETEQLLRIYNFVIDVCDETEGHYNCK